MIPLKLTLSNFMSYGAEPTELDLRGQHVLCLSGDNGNGKSAILDALTYALWGYTRASGSQASSEDDLIRLGADHLEVEVEFQLGDDRYRSTRRRSRGGKGAEWHLYMDDAGGAWRPIGGNGVRETQRTLVRILRMEYETFLNSAYIQQGRADEFTRQRPEARKRILADILDLSRFDRLEEMARAERDDAALAMRDLETELRYLEQQAGAEPGLREELAGLLTERDARDAALAACEAAVAEHRNAVAALAAKTEQCRQAEARLKESEALLRETEAERARAAARVSEQEALLAAAAEIESAGNRLAAARRGSQDLEGAVADLAAAQRDQATCKGNLEKRRQQRISDLRVAEGVLQRAEEQASRAVALAKQRDALDRRLRELDGAEDRHSAACAVLEDERERFAALKADAERASSQIGEQQEVLDLLAEPRSACPVCGSDLNEGRRERVIAAQQGRLAELKSDLQRAQAQGRESRDRRKKLEAEVADLARLCAEAVHLRARAAEVARQATLCAEGESSVEKARAEVDAIRRSLDACDYGAEERQALAAIAQRIAELTPAAEEHRLAVQQARELVEQGTERRLARLEQARRDHAQTVADVERFANRIRQAGATIESVRAEVTSLREGMREYAAAQAALAEAEARGAAAAKGRDDARGAVARAEQAIQACVDAREQMKTRRAERSAAANRRQAYSDLTAAFGKRGVQALIIENALPEIQEEANRLLARLSDNAMQVSLSTLRRARSGGGQVETLDITITDDAGTRPYEMYSGGEAFRVNFALRIALSRLLARRAGARLQTLIIDEGFGTQDAHGIERLISAIHAIQDEFALVLVISHVESLKDAFASRVEIVKTPSGSQINYLD